MSDTRITADEFLEMSLSSYRRHLIKDLLRLSKKTTLRPYVYFWRANFANKKNKDCLLFIDDGDRDWKPVIEHLNDPEGGDADRMASGVLKLFKTHDLDDDGDEDILIAIRSAHGTLKRNGVIDHINERLLDDGMDFYAILLSEVEDYTKAELKAEVPKRNKIKLKGFDLTKNSKSYEDVEDLEAFLRSVKDLLADDSPFEFVANIKLQIEQAEDQNQSENVSEELKDEAEKIDDQIDSFQNKLGPVIEEAEDLIDTVTFENQEAAEDFGILIGVLHRMELMLARLELELEESFGIPKD